ncbi:hypothetical protein [Roseomonas mucosa]
MDEQPTPHTYEQAAQALGINAEAVRARLRRGALRRGPRTNDGRPTVLLGPADIASIRSGVRPAVHPESGPDPDGHAALEALRGTVAILERELADAKAAASRADGRADRILQQSEAERARLLDLVEAERARAVAAEAEREETRRRLAEAEAALDAERRRGWLSRFFGRR